MCILFAVLILMGVIALNVLSTSLKKQQERHLIVAYVLLMVLLMEERMKLPDKQTCKNKL